MTSTIEPGSLAIDAATRHGLPEAASEPPQNDVRAIAEPSPDSGQGTHRSETEGEGTGPAAAPARLEPALAPAAKTSREESSQWCLERAAADTLSAAGMDTENGRIRFEKSALAWNDLAHLKQAMEDKRETDRWLPGT